MQIRYLDFGDVVPKAGIIGAARHLGWPVNGYRISLPKSINDEGGLNPFEKVILGIMRADGLRSAQQVSSEICLERDFVEGVLLRLKDKGLVDDSNRVTDVGKNELDEENGGLELRTAWMFRELVTGKMLPFVYLPKGDNPPRWKKEPQWAKSMKAANMRFAAPSPEEVLASLRETKRRVESLGKTIRLPRVGQIDVGPNPERFFLDCPIVMRDSDGRWRIADPFGYGYSRELESSFLREMGNDDALAEWIMKWSNSLVVSADASENSIGDSRAGQNARRLYPNLAQQLRTRADGSRTIGQIYAAIEWALFYSCRIRGFDEKVPELKFSTSKQQVSALREAMDAIGCDGSGYVAPVDNQELKSYLSGSAEMRVVLPMSLLQAADDSSHPLRRFCEIHPDFVARIERMKQRRDAPLHGGDSDRFVEKSAPDSEFMEELVSTLLPEVSFDCEGKPVDKDAPDAFRNVSFNAENSLMGEFGPAVPYLRMSRGAREALLSAERFWLLFGDYGDGQPFINDCYAALQAILDAEILSDRVARPDSRAFDPCSAALGRCDRLGLGELPGGLLSAKRAFIQDAMQGGNRHTLGPSLIVYLALADERKLNSIEESVPGYIVRICELISLRGHGNGSIASTREDLGKQRTFVFDVIKAILEV